jgi:tetratricopeptide (TPR) repeat protein
VDENQPKTIESVGNYRFKRRKLTWKTGAVLIIATFIFTIVISYMIAWKIVKGPVNLTYRANSFLIKGDINESLKNYEKALGRNPRLTMALTGKGLCLMYLGRYEEALVIYDQALILDPTLALAWQGKGLSYENLGRYEDAIQCYEKGLIIYPDNNNMLRLRNNLINRIPAPDH